MVIAAAAGYAVLMAGRWAGTSVAGLAFPQAGAPFPTTPFLAIAVAVGFVAAIAAGFLSARLSPASRRLGTMTLLVLIVLGAAVATARLGGAVRGPAGFVPLVTLLGVIGLWAGAMTERAVRGGPTR
jgi:hypothetical protein